MPNPKTKYYENGNVEFEIWYKDGDLHRLDGPADIDYHENGNVKYKFWWKDGKKITKEDFKKLGIEIIKQMKALSLFTPLELIRLKNEV